MGNEQNYVRLLRTMLDDLRAGRPANASGDVQAALEAAIEALGGASPNAPQSGAQAGPMPAPQTVLHDGRPVEDARTGGHGGVVASGPAPAMTDPSLQGAKLDATNTTNAANDTSLQGAKLDAAEVKSNQHEGTKGKHHR